MKSFTLVVRIWFATMLLVLAGAAAAQRDYPTKPIHIIVPFPPGASNDTQARLVGQKLTESFGVQILVENRGGGSTTIGAGFVAKSPPDGYTLMLTSTTHVLTPLLVSTPYDAVKDFAAIATTDSSSDILVVHPSVPANTLQEFIALAKSKPGQLNYASSSMGSANHLAAAIFESMTGVKMQHVPYKGGGPAVTDLLAGQVQLYFNNASAFVPHIKSGKLKAIAVTSDARLPALPQVPTFAESGLASFDLKNWHGVLAPAGTPKTVIDKLSAEIARILSLPDIRERIIGQGLEPFISSPEQLNALMKADTARYGQVIKALNLRLED